MRAVQLHAAADGPRDHATARSSNIARGPAVTDACPSRVRPWPTLVYDRQCKLVTQHEGMASAEELGELAAMAER